MDPLRAWARSWWSGVPLDVTIDAEDRRAFEEAFALDFAREVEVFVPIVSIASVVCWWFDPVVFARVPGAVEAYRVGRTVLLGVAACVVVALQLRPRWAPAIATIGGAVTTLVCATTVSALGPPSSPWVGCLYTFALGPIFWYLRPARRLVVTGLVVACLLGGYLGPRPEYLDDPAAPAMAIWLVFLAVVCLGVGLRTDRWRLRHWCAERDLAAERAHLSERVRETTAGLRAFAHRLDAVQDAERAHVARELHDELGQTLTAARLSLRLARQRHAQAPEAIGPNLDQVATLLETLTTQTRALVHDLRPPVLDDLGLVPALEWLAARIERSGGPRCTVDAPSTVPDLPGDLAATAFRCVQEALTNVVRHASASSVRIRVRCERGRLEVEVHDDGVGTDAPAPGGVGLVGMRERAEMVGGTFGFSSRAGAGCTVHLSLPVPG